MGITRYTMKLFFFAAWAILGLTTVLFIAGQLGYLRGRPPQLGLQDGRLKPPSKTDNSVSSQADLYPDHPQLDYTRIAPLTYSGDGVAAMKKLADLLKNREQTVVMEQAESYIYAQCSTAWLKFTDDIEFALDPARSVIDVRSASRLGRKDFGVNRKRVEAIRAAWIAAQ
jgi:uncharacterized protein (DUF1499 family)